MAEFTIRKHFEGPLEIVFGVASDFQQAAENIRGVERLEILTDGPISVGTRFRETRIMFGKESTEEMEITEFDAPHSYTVEAKSCGCHYLVKHEFVSDISGTHVRLFMETRPTTFLAKLMTPLSILMTGSMKKMVDADLEDLKQAAETLAREAKKQQA